MRTLFSEGELLAEAESIKKWRRLTSEFQSSTARYIAGKRADQRAAAPVKARVLTDGDEEVIRLTGCSREWFLKARLAEVRAKLAALEASR